MSLQVSNLVWDHSKSTGLNRLVLLALADRANDAGECFPGLASLARRCRSPKRSVQRAMVLLKKSGELRVEPGTGAKTANGMTNRYFILVTGDASSSHRRPSVIGTDDDKTCHGRPAVMPTDDASSPKQSVEQSVEQPKKLPPQPGAKRPVPSARRSASPTGGRRGASSFSGEGITSSPAKSARSAQPPGSAVPPSDAHQQIIEAWPSVVAEARGLEAVTLTPGQKKKILRHLTGNEVDDAPAFLTMLVGAVSVAQQVRTLSGAMTSGARDYQDLASFHTKFLVPDATRIFDHVGAQDDPTYIYDKVSAWWANHGEDDERRLRAEEIVADVLGSREELEADRDRKAEEADQDESEDQADGLKAAVASLVDVLEQAGREYALESDTEPGDRVVFEDSEYSGRTGNGGEVCGEYAKWRYLKFLHRKELPNSKKSGLRYVRMMLRSGKFIFLPSDKSICWQGSYDRDALGVETIKHLLSSVKKSHSGGDVVRRSPDTKRPIPD